MKFEYQVCSLELTKRLRELGVKQESFCYWHVNHINSDMVFLRNRSECAEIDVWRSEKDNCENFFSAFTVAELGEMLPPLIGEAVLHTFRVPRKKDWAVSYERMEVVTHGDNVTGYSDRAWVSDYFFSAPTEADARAEMLIYLLENKLMGESW